jgi:hypothetical protein
MFSNLFMCLPKSNLTTLDLCDSPASTGTLKEGESNMVPLTIVQRIIMKMFRHAPYWLAASPRLKKLPN